eukprot:4058844-Prymnesium_polylepis.1
MIAFSDQQTWRGCDRGSWHGRFDGIACDDHVMPRRAARATSDERAVEVLQRDNVPRPGRGRHCSSSEPDSDTSAADGAGNLMASRATTI